MRGGIWASIPPHRESSLFPWSFEHQFSSSSRILSETVGKWVLLMWGVRTLWGAIIIDKTTKLKIWILMWPTFAWLQQQQNGTMCYFFWNQRKKNWFVYTRLHLPTLVFSRLHSSSDWSTLAYTRPVTRLHLSTLV